jgi:predicted phosphodiesterase
MFTLIIFLLFFYEIQSINQINQIHIAQGKTPESMSISWVTNEISDSIVNYGTTYHLNMTSKGYEVSYYFNYPQFNVYQSGTIHHVELNNLKPNTQYFYKCGDKNQSELNTFITGLSVGSFLPITFGVLGDLGQTNDSSMTINHISNNKNIQLILHAGDLSYADCNQQLWDKYGILIEPLASKIPWMVGPGNHELEITNDNLLYLSYEARYNMPKIKNAELGPITIPPKYHDDDLQLPYCCSSEFQSVYNYGNSFYSFETGSAHIIFLNPYSTTDSKSEQYKWLQTDLKTVNRKITPWLIVVMHCPWYTSNLEHNAEKQTILMKQYMESLFYEFKVNIAITGHVHAYERTHPVYKNKTDDFGTVYITVGDGGNLEGHARLFGEQPEWSAFRNGTDYGYGTITLLNPNKLLWRWYRNQDNQFIFKDSIIICNSFFTKVYC